MTYYTSLYSILSCSENIQVNHTSLKQPECQTYIINLKIVVGSVGRL